MRIGAHVSAAGGLLPALDRGAAIGAEVVQIFCQSPRAWKAYAYSDELLATYRSNQAAGGPVTETYCHATYLINLATENPDLLEKSFDCLVENLVVATAIGSSGVVLHVGSHKGAGFEGAFPAIAERLVNSLDAAEKRAGERSCPLLLENAAGAGGTVGRSFDELATLIETAGGDDRLGTCIDTQHLFASGVTFATLDQADTVIADLDATIGLERLHCLHLNDSKVPLGANRDRHENLGDGEIGRNALGLLLSHPALQDTPAILEVPGDGDGPRESDVAVARAISAAGRKRRGARARRAK